MSILGLSRAVALFAASAVFALAAAALPTPAAGAAALGTLTVSPTVHVAGQAITFKGALPRPGRRAIHLQFHMNRPGDRWTDVKKSSARTTASGAFKFRFPAPGMFNISYRVVGGGMATKPYLFYAKPQAVTLSVNGEDEKSQYVSVPPVLGFTVVVDSAADLYPDRNLEPPVFAGRVITLQERVNGNLWRSVDTAQADANGIARFTVLAGMYGERVLRARAENFFENGHRIGWTASWPTYVRFSLLPGIPLRTGAPPAPSTVGRTPVVTDSTGATDASSQYGWYRPVYDFAWEYGQSLSSPPARGEVLKGRWQESSSGSGRVVIFNAALAFQSKLINKGPGDRGTTSAALTGNAQKYGRWEFRIWQNVREQDGRDFRMRVELVPEGTGPGACSPEAIRVADMELGQTSYAVGVRSARANAQWSHTKTSTPAYSGLHNFAVEVARDHITWFFDGKAFATVKNKAALSGKAWVPRMSLVGTEDGAEHNGSQFSVDWVRAWTLETGRQARNGHLLAKRAFSATC
ncbi:MAG: family 16 glycosylhydrolase [Nocardioides sp.]|nr:family 16 glycosylhydrolase [Nocardioides sp.]